MNYKNRIRNLERKIKLNNKLNFNDLLQPDFKYTGRAFENTKEIYSHFRIKDFPQYLTNEQMETLFKNGLLKHSIEQTINAMQENL